MTTVRNFPLVEYWILRNLNLERLRIGGCGLGWYGWDIVWALHGRNIAGTGTPWVSSWHFYDNLYRQNLSDLTVKTKFVYTDGYTYPVDSFSRHIENYVNTSANDNTLKMFINGFQIMNIDIKVLSVSYDIYSVL